MDPSNHEHAFKSLNAKIDPNKVISSIKGDNRGSDYSEVNIVDASKVESFTAMQWPLFDDGKPVGTNAMGYQVGGYFKRHQEAMQLAKAEAARKEAAEAAEAIRLAKADAVRKEEEKTSAPTVSLEELEAIRSAARAEGYTEGMNKGFNEGYAKGQEQGKSEGVLNGHKEGLTKGYEDGFRQGRDEGYAKGQEAGIANGNDIVSAQAERFRNLADMLANPIREIDETVTDEVVYLISRLAHVLLKREIKGDIEFLKNSIEKCYSLLPTAKQGAEIKVSEHDYALMLATIGRDYMNEQGWQLEADDKLEDGDIQVNTKVSSVQWRVNDRIDGLISAFLVNAAAPVSSARKEVIEGAPNYDEVPKKQIIPPRDILGMSEQISKNIDDLSPNPEFADEAERNLAAALDDLAAANAEDTSGIDPDASEIAVAHAHEQARLAKSANMTAPDAGAAAADGAALGTDSGADAASLGTDDANLGADSADFGAAAGTGAEQIPDAPEIEKLTPEQMAAARAQGGVGLGEAGGSDLGGAGDAGLMQ